MTEPAPLVSVVVPTYNSAEYLTEALASIEAQTWPALEVVVSDDGSSDATLRIADQYAATSRHPCRVVRTPHNLGPAGNFRHAVVQSQGVFVKFLIPDDLLQPEAIERLVEPMRNDPTVVLSTSRRQLVDSAGHALPDVYSSRAVFEDDVVLDGRTVGDRILRDNANYIGEPSTALFRRDAVEPAAAFTYGGTEFRVLADVSMWLSLCERGRVSVRSERLSSFRRHRNQDQRSVRLVLKGNAEWFRLVLLARRRGFLRRRRDLAHALVTARVTASGRLAVRLVRAVVPSRG